LIPHIIEEIKRPDEDLVKEFSYQSTATVHEAMGKRGAVHSSIKPLYSGMRLCGPAVTLKGHAADNLMLLKALDMARPGDIIVADMGQMTEAGPWGEITTFQAKVRGVGGFITNGSVRDALAIKESGFPVFCKSICIKGTGKEALGYINYSVSMGDTLVNPGDIILGDEDGVVVIPLQEAEEILQKSREREEREAEQKKRIKQGDSFFHFMGYDKVLQDKGCRITKTSAREENVR